MKIYIPFSEFFLENMTLILGTPPCTPHMEVPSPLGDSIFAIFATRYSFFILLPIIHFYPFLSLLPIFHFSIFATFATDLCVFVCVCVRVCVYVRACVYVCVRVCVCVLNLRIPIWVSMVAVYYSFKSVPLLCK